MGRTRAQPVEGLHRVSSGTAELVSDASDAGGWTLVVNGVPSSYVDLADPTRLEFEYMRWIGDVLDCCAPAQAALRVAHLGGAGCTLARYVAATRPGSTQVVFEHDEHLAALARTAFDLRTTPRFRVRVRDARTGVARLASASQDVLIRDAFLGSTVPPHLTTVEFVRDAARTLAEDGLYITNVADGTALRMSRAEAATALAVFRRVALVVEPSQLRGRRYGNVLLVASARPLPLEALTRRLSAGAVPARVLTGRRLTDLVAGHSPLTDLLTDPNGSAADPAGVPPADA